MDSPNFRNGDKVYLSRGEVYQWQLLEFKNLGGFRSTDAMGKATAFLFYVQQLFFLDELGDFTTESTQTQRIKNHSVGEIIKCCRWNLIVYLKTEWKSF
jgi:hypothetical protein